MPPRAGSASLEGSTRPSSKVRLARGLSTPSGGVRSTRGLPRTHPPRISRAVTRTCSRTRIRAFNALTQQGCATTLTRLGMTPRRCFANSQGRPSPPLFNTVWRGQCQLCDTMLPTPVRLTHRALEWGPVASSNIFYVLMQDHTVTSGRRDRSSPSLSALCGHPRHYSTTLGAVATSRRCWDVRGQDTATMATVPCTGFPSNGTLEPAHHGGRSTNYCAAALEAAPVQAQDAPLRLNRSGIRQDGRQLRSTVRHTATRIEIVRHAC
jgi:hypothetical protein